ncbi:unnamed protein product [Aphanomyces euteiches]
MNKYREERCIGRGSYGCAYLVTELKSGMKYVVKKIPIELMTEKEKHQAFAEVELLSKLSHPCIVQYKENFVEGTVLHLVMEYCDGGDLTARVQAKQDGLFFATSTIMDWFVQMAVAIKYLHQHHILHRDLKTSNIFLTSGDMVKLGDFGIARTLNSTIDHAKTVVGTPYYMSPEVCESKPYSYASDIWALGCVLYEMCALKHAFDAPNILMLIVKIIQHEFPPLPSCFPSEMTALLGALLNKDPEKRPSMDSILRMPFVQAHMQRLLRKLTFAAYDLRVDLQMRSTNPHLAKCLVIDMPTPAQVVPMSEEGRAGRQEPPRANGWVADEVEEAIGACFEKEELLKPNYESAYSEECSDSIMIDYGRKIIRRKALTIDHRDAVDKLRLCVVDGMPPLHLSIRPPTRVRPRRKRFVSASLTVGRGGLLEDSVGGESYGDSDNDNPYTSMSECDAEENFYSDDSDFDGHIDDEEFVDHAYSDDFEDTEAEVIEYENEEFSSDSDSSSSSPSKDVVSLALYSYDQDMMAEFAASTSVS